MNRFPIIKLVLIIVTVWVLVKFPGETFRFVQGLPVFVKKTINAGSELIDHSKDRG